MAKLEILALLLAIAYVSSQRERRLVVVDTEYGKLEGETLNVLDGPNGRHKAVSRWHGIPFAAPISPETRFMPPKRPQPWDGIRKAHRLPNACPQYPVGLLWITQPLWSHYSEDCLYLNVYAPKDIEGGPYPVMFWIHGGGYLAGGSHQYPGHFLAGLHDVVVVSVNYRVGALGFMSTGDSTVPGNMGLLDQNAALVWVRDNIHHFGGDPKKVTLFGQSAGASSSSLHMFMPESRGLFHQIIAESGSDQVVWGLNGPGQVPESYTQLIASRLDCPTSPSTDMMECLRKVPINDIHTATFDCTPGYFCQGFAPVVDGKTIPDTPINMRRKGDFQKNKILGGHCKDDGSLYTMILIPESMDGGFNRTEFMYYLKERLMSIFVPLAPELEEELTKAIDFYYSDWPALNDEDRNREVFNKLITDFGFGAGGDVQIKHQSKYNDVYYYVLGYRGKTAGAMYPDWMGVPHNGELPYVFGWSLLPFNPEIREDAAIPIDVIPWDEEDEEWAYYITKMWTNFAKYGDPTPEPVPAPNGNPATVWPKYNSETQEYMYLDRVNERRREYRQRNFALWHNYFPFLADYKVYPAGEPLILPQDAENGWKTWSKKSVPDNSTVKGFDNGVFQGRLQSFFRQLGEEALKQVAATITRETFKE